ncbi:MAG TPA: hypothetical protein VEC14_13020 [Reyranellaceae bacterium]|nr:hypothetical protein [Reyranellaceae bacterium]
MREKIKLLLQAALGLALAVGAFYPSEAIAELRQTVFYVTSRLAPGFVLRSPGASYGQVSNTGTNQWALTHSTSRSSTGTAALTWDTSGNVAFPAGATGLYSRTTAQLAALTGTAGQIAYNSTLGAIVVSTGGSTAGNWILPISTSTSANYVAGD